MSWEIWLAYVLASTILLTVPGPTILLVVGQSLGSGKTRVWSTVAAVVLGDFTALTFSLAGLGSALSASAASFTVLKWVGAAYLFWLGIRMWRSPPPDWQPAPGRRQGGELQGTLHVFAVTALNPKGIVFFVAFLPQFISPSAPMLTQIMILGGTFLVLGGVNTAAYALLAGSLGNWLRRPASGKAVNRVGGGLLMGAGAMTAALRRAV